MGYNLECNYQHNIGRIMINTSGKARIRHKETGQIYEINASEVHFQSVESHERGMGPEECYSALFDHPELGDLVWEIWEYPIGALNHRETNVGPHELLEDINIDIMLM